MPKEQRDKNHVTKLFVDASEDIVFIIEKIRTIDDERALLIIPKHAALTSSLVNLKLLSRQLTGIGKVVILVTGSDLAQSKSEETSLLAFEKVENVNEEKWKEAELLIEKLNNDRLEIREKLIKARQISNPSIDEVEETEVEIKSEKIPTRPKLREPEPDIEEIEDRTPKRLPPKIVEVGAFSVMAGGDISENSHLIKKKAPKIPETEEIIDEEDTIPDIRKEEQETKVVKTEEPKHFMLGKDVTSNTKHKVTKTEPRETRQSKAEKAEKEKNPPKDFKKYRKFIIIAIVLFLAYLFVSSTFLEAKVMMIPIDQEISVSEKASARLGIDNVDPESKLIPMRKLSVTKSGSESAIATGETVGGTQASGVVDITNKTDAELTLEKGTVIKSLNGNLEYVLEETIKIPARLSELTFSTFENAPISSKGFGDEYNISSVDVKVADYKTSTEVSGRIYKKLKGGEAKDIVVVSDEDVNNLKEGMTQTLTKTLEEELDIKIKDEDFVIEGTQALTEIAFEIDPPIGTEAKQFDISKLEYEYSVMVIDKDDLNELANTILSEQFGENVGDDLLKSENAEISDVAVQEDGTVTFSISKSANITPEIDEEYVFDKIKDKNTSDALNAIEDMEEFSDIEIKISPFFAPGFLKKVPDSQSKVKIEIGE